MNEPQHKYVHLDIFPLILISSMVMPLYISKRERERKSSFSLYSCSSFSFPSSPHKRLRTCGLYWIQSFCNVCVCDYWENSRQARQLSIKLIWISIIIEFDSNCLITIVIQGLRPVISDYVRQRKKERKKPDNYPSRL